MCMYVCTHVKEIECVYVCACVCVLELKTQTNPDFWISILKAPLNFQHIQSNFYNPTLKQYPAKIMYLWGYIKVELVETLQFRDILDYQGGGLAYCA